jgi:hypothetical protein
MSPVFFALEVLSSVPSLMLIGLCEFDVQMYMVYLKLARNYVPPMVYRLEMNITQSSLNKKIIIRFLDTNIGLR